MKLSLFSEAVLAAASLSTGAVAATPIINVDHDPVGSLNITAWALIYTYPLAIFANFAGSVLQNVSVNEIFHQRTLATTSGAAVIKPNVDTIYSRVVLDLSSHDIELTVPPITDGRYWNYPVYDPYGNDLAEIGSVNGNKPGLYLIRRADDVFAQPGFVNTTSNCTVINKKYEGIVNVPTTFGTMLIRLLLLHNTTEDLNAVHTIQNASHLRPIPRTLAALSANPAVSLHSLAPAGGFLGIDGPEKQLSFAAKLVALNQPGVYSQRYRVATILARAGLYTGAYHCPPSLNVTEAAAVANASITADVQAPAHVRNEGNGWELQIPSYQGNYGTHYAAAAYVALYGYQQLRVDQTLYPGYGALGFTTAFNLEANQSVLFTFSAKPKLKATGFWSLTVYGSDQYLIPNELNRFEAGDRNYNTTYIDGGYVYGPSANSSQDGPFQILAQPADLPPPANWTGNWLPVAQNFTQIGES